MRLLAVILVAMIIGSVFTGVQASADEGNLSAENQPMLCNPAVKTYSVENLGTQTITGDTTHVLLWTCLLCIALIILVVALILYSRRKASKEKEHRTHHKSQESNKE